MHHRFNLGITVLLAAIGHAAPSASVVLWPGASGHSGRRLAAAAPCGRGLAHRASRVGR